MTYIIQLLPWISQIIYSLTILPQILQNREEESTSALSSFFIYLTFAGFSFTLLYSFLKDLPIAYQVINPIGMLLALVLVYQDFKYKLHKYYRYTMSRGQFYWYVTTYLMTFFVFIASVITAYWHPITIGRFSGWLMVGTWAVLLLPQLYKTYVTKDVSGMNLLFIILPIIGGMVEFASVFLMGLPLPSLFNGARAVILSCALLAMFFLYRK